MREGKVAFGGSPYNVTLLPRNVREFANKLYAAGREGLKTSSKNEERAAGFLLDRGLADPLPIAGREFSAETAHIVVPVYGDPQALERCLTSLKGSPFPITVVDDASSEPDASAIKKLAKKYGARLIVRQENGGPGAARTTGFDASESPFVAFIDSDAVAEQNWVEKLLPLFDDPVVGAVGPRVRPDVTVNENNTVIDLYEETRSEIDMGPLPTLVVYGSPVGWLPSASAIVRREAVTDPPFEPGLRVGEDVDLFWRMEKAGWHVRYVVDVENKHAVRQSMSDFAGRRAMYGGSAADLEIRHPRRLIPAQPAFTGLGMIAAIGFKKPLLAAAFAGYELIRHRQTLDPEMSMPVVAEATGRSLWSDGFWLGHLLRRDWWPIGLIVLLLTPRSRMARVIALTMLWEPVRDHLLRPTRLDPGRSLALRAVDDASYGTGVIKNSIRRRVLNTVLPRVRFPEFKR
ncbi:MAG TPA: mycofactocin biosynthesis glycosyltransferase MftF [Microbacteriaceae bacterium]|nr:mycofactocin biosynthesis glycosyltransferase MftF [Microbacteriaceae bacterium]